MNRTDLKLNMRKTSSQGFTLVELLVVIALTVILLTLVFAPLIQAFNFTQQAQATAQAQDAARSVTEQLTRELGSAAGVRDTTDQYLDLPLVNKSGDVFIAHAYNAYIDIIPPRVSAGTIVDPTVDQYHPTVGLGGSSISGISQELIGSGVSLPLSAGSTVIRYFVGLRYPIDPRFSPETSTNDPGNGAYADRQPYTNRYDGLNVASGDSPWSTSYTVKQGLNNTYQLYRVNFQPYIPYETGIAYNGTATPAVGTFVPNTNLFPTTADGLTPIYDDPDFFRIVAVGDTDHVAGQGDSGFYTAATAEAHNFRVYNWFKLAKSVIATHEVDLAGLTRIGNKVVYDQYGNPVDSYENDGTTLANRTPIIRTTMNFAPALISNDPMAATNTSDASQAYGAAPPAAESSAPYVPTEFSGEYGNWQGKPVLTIAKTTATGTIYLQTTEATSSGATLGTPNFSTQTTVNTGDLELADVNPDGTVGSTAVYDITAGAPITPSGSTVPTYDALILNENSGTVSFALPALPPMQVGQSALQTPPDTYWYYTSSSNGTVNLETSIDNSKYTSPPTSPLLSVPNAQLVVNSERVVGPDEADGVLGTAPSTDFVQYTRVNAANTAPGPDQYTVNYQTGTISVDSSKGPLELQIAYSYQNNIGANSTVDTLRSSYYTASMMRLNLGIRVYGANTGVSEYFSLDSQVAVSNTKAN